jgi:hypothetical protein
MLGARVSRLRFDETPVLPLLPAASGSAVGCDADATVSLAGLGVGVKNGSARQTCATEGTQRAARYNHITCAAVPRGKLAPGSSGKREGR